MSAGVITMNKLAWCLKQKKGLRLVVPNDLISENYLAEAQKDLDMVDKSNQKWRAVTAYYACYNALYAVLARAGIKCEIHDCTIALMGTLGFSKESIAFLSALKSERIDVQYYLKQSNLEITSEKVKRFILSCEEIILDLTSEKIDNVRKLLVGQ